MYSNDFWAAAKRITAVLIQLLTVFSVTHNELRSMRLAISRRIDRALNFSASWIGCNSAESIEVTQRDD